MKNFVIGLSLITASVVLTVVLTGKCLYTKGYSDGVQNTVKTIKEDLKKAINEMESHKEETES